MYFITQHYILQKKIIHICIFYYFIIKNFHFHTFELEIITQTLSRCFKGGTWILVILKILLLLIFITVLITECAKACISSIQFIDSDYFTFKSCVIPLCRASCSGLEKVFLLWLLSTSALVFHFIITFNM